MTFLGAGSLSLGIAVALLIGLWVVSELSFDQFHEKEKDIYRLYTEGKNQITFSTFRQVGDRVKYALPEIKEVCRISAWGLEVKVNADLLDRGTTVWQAEENFFTFFTFPLVAGDAYTCLQEKGNLVISEKVAKRWFGEENPIGKVVQAEGKDWKIAGVMKDFPYNSHIAADIVMPFGERARNPDCGGDIFCTYFYIPALEDTEELEQKLTRISDETLDIMREVGARCKLQRLRDIHFGVPGLEHAGNRTVLLILMGTGVAILLLACINFINLYIARTFLRLKTLGIMRSCGAGRKELMLTIWGETLGYVLIAAAMGVLLAWLCLPWFNWLANYQLKMDFTFPIFYWLLAGVVAFTLLAAGGYPAFYMLRMERNPALYKSGKGHTMPFVQQSLLVVQFAVSIVFLISIFFVHKQVDYMMDYDLGYDRENVVYCWAKPVILSNYTAIRNELLKEPAIKDVVLRSNLPMFWSDGYPVKIPGNEERVESELCQVKENYFDMMGIEFVEGENPFLDHRFRNGVVIDELAVKRMNLKVPLDQELRIWGQKFVVKGVVKTVKAKGLYMAGNSPLVYMFLDEFYSYNDLIFMCKIQGNPQQALKAIQQQWENYLSSDYPFEYEFLDEVYRKMYDSESRLGNIFFCAMIIMFLLSVCGLFAMAYYVMRRRRKEIGVRKVNGAEEWQLLVMLNLSFIRLVFLSFGIACLMAWYFLDYWMEQFVVHTDIDWPVFAGVGVIAVAVTILTVCWQTLQAARLNPVEVLKNE